MCTRDWIQRLNHSVWMQSFRSAFHWAERECVHLTKRKNFSLGKFLGKSRNSATVSQKRGWCHRPCNSFIRKDDGLRHLSEDEQEIGQLAMVFNWLLSSFVCSDSSHCSSMKSLHRVFTESPASFEAWNLIWSVDCYIEIQCQKIAGLRSKPYTVTRFSFDCGTSHGRSLKQSQRAAPSQLVRINSPVCRELINNHNGIQEAAEWQ